MKQRKKIRDGIGLYPPSNPKTHSFQKNPRPLLLAAVHLPAVWFLVFSWWQSLTSVFSIRTDTTRLYIICFCFTAILVSIWNAPLRVIVKCCVLLLLLCLAGSWIWRHPDAAFNVINLTANAYLAVCEPNANPYPIRPVSDSETALMFAIFLLPLLLIWSLMPHIRKGKLLSILLLLAPAAFILIKAQVPSELSCWLLLLSGAVYAAVCGCHEGHTALFKGTTAACMLLLLILLSASASRPLEQYKLPSDGFYAHTREFIRTGWIKPLQDSYIQAKAERDARKSALENEPAPENPDSDGPQSANAPSQAEQEQDPPDSGPDTDTQADLSVEPSDDAPDTPLFPTGNDAQSTGNTTEQDSSHANNGTAENLPDLNALSHFRPDSGTRLTLTLDSRPEETVYYPSAYGVLYENGRWNGISLAPAASLEIPVQLDAYLQYPESLDRLKALCQEHAPQTLATLTDISDFIQKEFEEHTVYSFEPGSTPPGQDFAEYFLFENQKGFCVHFATTAALMYRICGFPSRYVQGYAIPPSAFHRQEDGSYVAEATGEMGHAWCEVVEDGEWVLKEHTLPYYGTRPEPGIPAATSSRHSWERDAAGWGLLALRVCATALVSLLAFSVLFFSLAALRRQRRYRMFRTIRHGAGIRRVYCAIYDTAVFQGMEKTDILSLQGFQRLRDFFPEIPADAMEWLYQTVLETMFYQKTVTKEDTKHAWQIYQQFSRMIRKNLSPSRKFIYNYIKVM